MFGIDTSELMLLAAVALVVIGPKDLPRAMRFVGQWVGRARGMARHFRSGIDEIIRQAELDEMQKKWAAENARIMAEHPMPPPGEEDDAAHAFGGDYQPMTQLPAPESAPAAEAQAEWHDGAHDPAPAGDQLPLFEAPVPDADADARPAEAPKP